MVAKQGEAVRLFQLEADGGRVASLKQLAAGMLPTVQQHLALATETAGGGGGDGDGDWGAVGERGRRRRRRERRGAGSGGAAEPERPGAMLRAVSLARQRRWLSALGRRFRSQWQEGPVRRPSDDSPLPGDSHAPSQLGAAPRATRVGRGAACRLLLRAFHRARDRAAAPDRRAGRARRRDSGGRPPARPPCWIGPAGRGRGVSLALLGTNEIAATTSNFFRSTTGQFIAKKVRVRFDVAITNRTTVPLLTPTFPTPPAGTTR